MLFIGSVPRRALTRHCEASATNIELNTDKTMHE